MPEGWAATTIFLTCYSGYALDEAKDPGKMDDLRRHVLCVKRRMGSQRGIKSSMRCSLSSFDDGAVYQREAER